MILTRHYFSGKWERPLVFVESYDIRIVSVVIGITLYIRCKIKEKELKLKRNQLWQTMAKAASLVDTLGEHLKCAVCLDQYTEPKVLPCLHTFCKRCLQGVLNREGAVWKLICPTCRTSAKVSLNLFEQSFSGGLTCMLCRHWQHFFGRNFFSLTTSFSYQVNNVLVFRRQIFPLELSLCRSVKCFFSCKRKKEKKKKENSEKQVLSTTIHPRLHLHWLSLNFHVGLCSPRNHTAIC